MIFCTAFNDECRLYRISWQYTFFSVLIYCAEAILHREVGEVVWLPGMDVNRCRARQTIVVSLAYYSESSTRPSFRPFPCPILPFPPPGTGVGDLSAEVVERTAREMVCSSSDEKVYCVALVVDGGGKIHSTGRIYVE